MRQRQRKLLELEKRSLRAIGVPKKGTRETGLEPATSAVTGRCSDQLNYSRISDAYALWAQKGSNL
jgi:hypothetical protein